ncbi:MAG: carbohydrate-binding domain-containing protein [Acetobacter sp.]|nr:carbohydrate-binding domain-containing protein [Bacteroides sp.]MCM1340402.1 carbohydrate-binding domain-containing protein [Acetobacter sp.]MCM1432951.1 carbohydrate-binding domain-containing protein [Clostridiales bacterium]
MKLKKAICVMLAAAMITTSMAACSKEKPQEAEATVVVTDKSGDAVTTDNGKVVVADKKTSTTKAVDAKEVSSTTKNGETTAAKTTAKTTTQKGAKTTTKKGSATTKKTAAKTTAKATTKKPAGKPASTTAQVDRNIYITLQKNMSATVSSKIDASGVTVTNKSAQNTIRITKPGDYVINQNTGNEAWHGQIVVMLKNTEEATLRFENVNITTQQASAIKILDASINKERNFMETETATGTDADNALKKEIKEISKQNKAPNVSISFPTGTTSSINSGANSYSGVVYNESKLTLKGNGKINVSATRNANNAICSTKSITIKNVAVSLSTASAGTGAGRGIFSFSKVNLESGSLTIDTDGDGIRCESFNVTGGTADINSRSSDGVDADDAIVISGGTVTSVAVKKSSYKVRRVNNTENGLTVDGIRKEKGDTFAINGGTVRGESKNITTVQPASKQANIICRSVKASNTTESKRALQFTIKSSGSTVAKSTTECIKFLYSSSGLSSSKKYSVTGHSKNVSQNFSADVKFTNKVGDARVVANR